MACDNIKAELLQVALDIDNSVSMNHTDAKICREAVARLARLEEERRDAKTARCAREGLRGMAAMVSNASAQPAAVTHAELVRLVGELDGVSLESEPSAGFPTLQDVVVYLEVAGKRVELIRAVRSGEGIISHHVTRLGVGECLSWVAG